MKFADEILKNKKAKREQLSKEHQERVNLELFEIEKAQNKYESDLQDTKMYITVPLIIKTQEAKDSLKEHGYIIDKISNDIEVNTTRIWLNEKSFNIATRREIKPINIAENIHKEEDTENKIYNKDGNININNIKEMSLEEAVNLIRKKQKLKNGLWNINM